MNEIVQKDILQILKEALNYVKEADTVRLMELSNRTVHDAAIFQDEDSVSIAVIIYALSKVIQRTEGSINHKILNILHGAIDALSSNDFPAFRGHLRRIVSEISRIDSKLKLYIKEVINQAEIKKGSRMYEHGISLARASHVLGISQWELMNYIGKTSIPDTAVGEIDIRSRLAFARSLFR